MPAPPPPAAWASWSACTSFRVRPTTSKRFSRSASALARPARPQRRAQFLQQPFVPDNQQRLRRLVEQIEKVAAIGARIDVAAVREQLHARAPARGIE